MGLDNMCKIQPCIGERGEVELVSYERRPDTQISIALIL